MADQKSEDMKSPLRRGVRPFTGPAGTAAARPFLRPVATPQRATAAPFVPPVVPGKPALGSPAAPPKAPTPVLTQALGAPNSDATSLPRPRPVTSEMIAVDAFDAFDTVWGADEQPAATTESREAASPLDEKSLGGDIDAQAVAEAVWADDITAAAEVAAEEAAPSVAEDAVLESAYTIPTSAIPAWLEDDAPMTSTPAGELAQAPEWTPQLPDDPPATPASEAGEYDASYEITEWTPAHGVPAADDISPLPDESLADAPTEPSLGALVQATDSAVETPTAAPAPRIHDTRIAETLDRLANRIRSGEIDVSSIAPDAPDAAVLASVLAALLGGSSSR